MLTRRKLLKITSYFRSATKMLLATSIYFKVKNLLNEIANIKHFIETFIRANHFKHEELKRLTQEFIVAFMYFDRI